MKKTVAKILVVLIPAMSLPQLSFGSTEKNTSPTESDSYLVQRHLEEKEIRRPENFAQAIAAALELFNLATSELDKFIGKHTGEIGVVNTLPFNRMLICQEVLERLTAIEENIGRYLSEKSTPLSQIKLIRNKIELIDPYAGIRSATSKRLKADLKKLHTSIVATDKKMIKEAERKAGNCKSISTQTKVLLGTGAAVVVVATIAGIACKVKKVGPFRSPSKTEAQQIAYENKIEKVVLDSKLKTQEMQTQHQEELQRARNGYERETLKHFVSTLETQQKAQQAEAASQFKSALESLKTSGTQQDEKINKLQMQYDQQVKTIDEKHATLIAANQSAMQSQKLADEKTLQDVIDANKKTATELTSQQATGMTQMQKTLDGKLTQAGKQQLKELMTQQTQAQKDGLSTLLHENKTLENQLTNQQTLHNQQVQKSLDLQLAAATEKQEALKEFVTETCRTLSDETKAALAQHDGNLVQFTTQQQAAIAEHKELTQQQQQAAATQLKDILVLQAQTQNAGLSAMQLQQDTLATQLTDQQTAYMTAMQKTLDGKLTQAGKEQLKEILTQQKEKLDAGLQTLQKANQQHRMQMKQAVTDQLTNQQTLHNQLVQKSLDLQLAAATEKQEALKEFVTETCRTLSEETKKALEQQGLTFADLTKQQQAAIAGHKELTQQQQQAVAKQIETILVQQAKTLEKQKDSYDVALKALKSESQKQIQQAQQAFGTQLNTHSTQMHETLEAQLTERERLMQETLDAAKKEQLEALQNNLNTLDHRHLNITQEMEKKYQELLQEQDSRNQSAFDLQMTKNHSAIESMQGENLNCILQLEAVASQQKEFETQIAAAYEKLHAEVDSTLKQRDEQTCTALTELATECSAQAVKFELIHPDLVGAQQAFEEQLKQQPTQFQQQVDQLKTDLDEKLRENLAQHQTQLEAHRNAQSIEMKSLPLTMHQHMTNATQEALTRQSIEFSKLLEDLEKNLVLKFNGLYQKKQHDHHESSSKKPGCSSLLGCFGGAQNPGGPQLTHKEIEKIKLKNKETTQMLSDKDS